jgi:hypothetical protein
MFSYVSDALLHTVGCVLTGYVNYVVYSCNRTVVCKLYPHPIVTYAPFCITSTRSFREPAHYGIGFVVV